MDDDSPRCQLWQSPIPRLGCSPVPTDPHGECWWPCFQAIGCLNGAVQWLQLCGGAADAPVVLWACRALTWVAYPGVQCAQNQEAELMQRSPCCHYPAYPCTDLTQHQQPACGSCDAQPCLHSASVPSRPYGPCPTSGPPSAPHLQSKSSWTAASPM